MCAGFGITLRGRLAAHRILPAGKSDQRVGREAQRGNGPGRVFLFAAKLPAFQRTGTQIHFLCSSHILTTCVRTT